MSPISSLKWRSLSKHLHPTMSLFEDVLRPIIPKAALQRYTFEEEYEKSSLMLGLKEARIKEIPNNRVKEITFHQEIDEESPLGSTLYVRDFYPRLYDQLLSGQRAVLMGNPGISKSWFQWYMMYNLVHDTEYPYKVIIRQEGQDLAFYFPQTCQVFETISISQGTKFLSMINPDVALYLVEPLASLEEPRLTGIKTVITSSPDRRRYKEFNKRGGTLFYMPVWELDELISVGAHIQAHTTDDWLKEELNPEKIEARYYQFGGIFRWVIPRDLRMIQIAERNQCDVLNLTKPSHIFRPGANIERRDEVKESISHLILQYRVAYGGEHEGAADEFTNFELVLASEYVKDYLHKGTRVSGEEFVEFVHQLNCNFALGDTDKYLILFELVVSLALERNTFNWEMYVGGKWQKRKFNFEKKLRFGTLKEKTDQLLLKMEPNVLYQPADKAFPVADMFWIEEEPVENGRRRVFCIQVTLAEKHQKPLSAYERFFERLQLDREKDEVVFYIITNPLFTEKYASMHGNSKFIKEKGKNSLNIQFIILKADELHLEY